VPFIFYDLLKFQILVNFPHWVQVQWVPRIFVENPNRMIRPYVPTDFDALIHLLRLNTPAYFGAAEEPHFATFLKSDPTCFFVIERQEMVVSCAGYRYQAATQTGQVSWFVFHPHYQRQGLGKEMLQYCLEGLREKAPEKIIVRTSQLVEGFFAQAGFVTTLIDKDYWSPGYDLYLMELKKAIPKPG